MSTQAKQVRKIIRIDEDKCTGCAECVPSCAEGAIAIIDGKARLVSETYCDGLGACLGTCPEDALHIEEREADRFDEEAVEAHLRKQAPPLPLSSHPAGPPAQFFQGCPSAALRQTKPKGSAESKTLSQGESALGQWPIQLHLVPPHAPFLKGSDLLIAADCVPFAHAGFHEDLLKGRTLLIACPKLDDTTPYLPKLVEIFNTCALNSVTIVHMEVPCCHGLPAIAEKALEEAGSSLKVRRVNIGIDGRVRSDTLTG